MRWFLRCLYVISRLELQIMVAFAAFVIWTLVRWIMTIRSIVFTWRDRLGAIGLLAGSLSWALFAWMNILYTFERKMVAHGSVFIIYEITANSLALLGFILALTGRGWLRRSASVISLVMMFHWFGMFFVSPGLQQYITIASFTTLFVWGITSFAWAVGRWRRSQVARTSSLKNDLER